MAADNHSTATAAILALCPAYYHLLHSWKKTLCAAACGVEVWGLQALQPDHSTNSCSSALAIVAGQLWTRFTLIKDVPSITRWPYISPGGHIRCQASLLSIDLLQCYCLLTEWPGR